MRFYVAEMIEALLFLKNVMRSGQGIFYGTLIYGNGWG